VAATNTDNDGNLGPIALGVSVDRNARFVVRVTGTVTASQNGDLPCTSWSYPGLGDYGPSQGTNPNSSMGASFGTSTNYPDITLHLAGDAWESDTVSYHTQVQLYWWRFGIIGSINCPNGGGGGLYALSGSQQVEVLQFPADSILLQVTPGTTILADSTAHFSASMLHTPLEPGLWEWTPDGGVAVAVSDCYGNYYCDYRPTSSGTMTIHENTYFGDRATSLHIDVVPCPWRDDSLIDNKAIRAKLHAEFVASAAEHLEHGGGIYAVTGTHPTQYVVMNLVVAGTATECRNTAAIASSDSNYVLVGIWHTHPLQGGDTFTNCPSYAVGAKAAKGPSRPFDYGAQKQFGVPEYIVDPTDVFRIKTNAGRRWWQSPTTLTRKNWKSCPNWNS